MSWASADRLVVHLNVADFASAVERVVDPRLRERPVIVAPPRATRAAVYDMSDEAFRAGVRKGMPLSRALKACPDARVVGPHPEHYERAMRAFLGRALPYSPLVEAGEGNGHLFLDLTGSSRLFGPPQDVAWRIRKDVRSDLGFDPIWSLASNKLVAKIATRLVKPRGEYIVRPGGEEELLRPLPVYLLPGLEREDLAIFRELNVVRAGQAALWTPEQLAVVFGRRGEQLYRIVRGIDHSPVRPPGKKPPEVSLEHDFENDSNDLFLVESALRRLTDNAGFDLREQGLRARRTAVWVYYSDGARLARQRTDRTGTANDYKLFALAREALALAWRRRVRVRKLKLVCDRLTRPPGQLELFPEERDETQALDGLVRALDLIRNKYGPGLVQTGRTMALEA
ncbi:MAG: hypothetical protein V1816_02180 [Pseudomonadota bacterium]